MTWAYMVPCAGCDDVGQRVLSSSVLILGGRAHTDVPDDWFGQWVTCETCGKSYCQKCAPCNTCSAERSRDHVD